MAIQQPTIFLLGKLDVLVPAAVAPKVDNLIGASQTHILQRACHAPFLSSTSDFMQLLIEFANMQELAYE